VFENKRFQAALRDFEKEVVNSAKANLRKRNKNVTGELSDSIDSEVSVMKNSIRVFFEMDLYGWFQDQGVKGVKSGKSLSNFSYKSSSNVIGMEYHTKTFKKWLEARRVQRRDKKGRFLSYEQSGYAMATIVKNYGIKPSMFFTKPFNKALKRLEETAANELGFDLQDLLGNIIDENFKK